MTAALGSELSGYKVTPLREGDFPLYRGYDDSLAPVLLVTAEDTSLACLKRLEHEYALRAELDVAWAARPVALSRYRGRLTLVLEDPGGEPLDQRLGRPFEISEFLRIAIPLAGALRQVHERGLIHKDIKPANVLVNVASGGVWLTGFGIAARVPRERHTPEAPEMIAGTLAYMAPEQTGRMNRSIDARSDLYSLGITFYEMLTGTLPFTATDPMEWVHCHIARQPVPPAEQAPVPKPLSAIVMKLLAKTAEDRYQTAAGVKADLRKCLAAWESFGQIDPFPLGTQDVPDRLMIPERLYGRECEIDTLLAAFDRVVAQGTPELVLVSGYSGIGKSSVVNELQKALVPPRGLFASGKFDQYQRNVPYATLAQAFQSLVHRLLGQGEAALGPWRDALSEALGPNGQLIVNLVPELELVIGAQPPVADVPPQEAKNRFQMFFRRFLGVFARKEHPLALFLDDLQWLDAATLDLLEYLLTHSEVRHLLLVGAYRENEVGPAHPLMRTLEAIRRAEARVQEIVLAPLGLDDVGQLIAAALHCEPERARPLAQRVQEKTGGNPFFAIQFFSALTDEGLLTFDPAARAWQWDMDRIRAKSYSDNVVDLMAEKLKRLSATTQDALKQLACLGSIAAIDILTLVHGEAEETIHATLGEAVHAGLVFRLDSAYKFLHDRIQQAAYSLIPQERRAEVHLALGRVLHSRIKTNELAEHLFDVANQFNRGATRLVERDEKAQVATINLRAGQRAKASAGYASACVYFSAGMALLDERDWGSQYELTFSLWLERAECEFLSGNFEDAEQLIGELLQRGASKVDQAAVYHLKVLLHIMKSENPQAVDSALACLQLFGIDMPAHPSWDHVQAAYETVWQTLNGRPIESLIDLPLMTDPELQAAMQVLSVLTPAAYFTDFHLYCLQVCRMVSVGMQHGTSGASAHAYGYCGVMLGPVFHRYRDAHRFAKLACDLVEKHGFIAYQAKVHYAMGTVAFWSQPIASAIDFMRAGLRTAIETGDLTFACYSMFQSVTGLLLQNDPLDAVWRESEMALDFARKAGFRDAADIIVSQQLFIATMRGQTATFSTFSDTQFDEAVFETQLTGGRMTTMICWYWINKLKARFLSGDYAEALAAGNKAKALLWATAAQIQVLDYFYYGALTVAACYENASADEQARWRDHLTAHRQQLREWADNYPPTFGDKYALVSAEIARLEGRDADSMRLYEEAIRLAREHSFVQNEALAHEVAARFYAARGVETIAHVYLHNARSCYFRWGALGKVRQLDQRYPRLREESARYVPTATIGAAVEQLDLDTVVKASHAVSGEIVLSKLIEKLMRIAVEHAGAERGLLVLLRGDEPQIEAEATIGHGRVEVTVRQAAVTPLDLPLSALHYVIRTRERVVLHDASAANLYAEDEYVRRKRPRSVLCLPIVKQTKPVGALYLENNLTPRAFTADRVAVLELLASQAAISLENARLYSDLQRSEAFLAQGQNISSTGSFGWNVLSGEMYWSEETYRIFDYALTATPTAELVLQRVHPDDRALVQQIVDRASNDGTSFDTGYRLLMPDGSVKHVHVLARALKTSSGNLEFVGAVMDVTAAKQAEEKIRQSERDLRQLLDHTPEHITEFGPDGSPLNNNQAALDYHGLTLEEWRSADLRTLLHPQDAERMTREHRSKFLSGSSYQLEVRLTRKDGQHRWFLFRFNPMVDEQGHLTRWYAAATDIEDRKQAEERLQQSEAYLAEAQRLSHTGSWAWAPTSGEIRYCSEECYRVLGFDPHGGQPQFETFFRRIHPDDQAKTRENLERARREITAFELDHQIVHPGGEIRDIHIVGHPVLSPSGDLVEFVGTVIDVTERKRAEEEQMRLGQRLRQAEKMEAVGRLAGGIAHDFNNVLAGVFAYGEMLIEEAPADSPLKRYAQNVLTAATRGRELVEQILTYSRSQRGKRAPVDVADVVAETLELLRGSLPAGIHLEASAPASPVVVIGDATQLHQVVMNLCSNAIQAMRAGGILRVMLETAELSTERALSHGTLGKGRYLRLIVEDSGSGMDEATLARIFEPFFTTKEVGQGTGLGLSLVYAIITDSGGAIDVKSAPQQGSTFTIYLPRSEVTLATAESGPATPLRGHGECVLLIDDEAPVLAAAAEVLSRLGYEAVSCSDSHAALTAFEACPERFDVVVTDDVMPGLTGTGLARALRNHRPDLPIVLVSGYSSAILTQDALAAGVSELLTKPLESREIAATLARVLHRTA